MKEIKNEAKLLDDAVTNARRSAFELRATWMAEFYLEAKKDGIDLEPIMRRAIRKVGSRNGQAELDAQGGDLCVSCFGKNFMKVPGTTFEMQPTRDENGEFDVDFHYCPLLTAWQKLGLDQETCALLCDIAMEGETEPAESKLDKWFEAHATPAVQNVLMTCAAFVGVVLALFLFTFLPTFLTGLVMRAVPLGRWPRVILEGVLKMAIFLGYMFLCTRMKELHRVFEYHGAEHKTIACYEAGDPLTVENVRKYTRFHPRCGTSFLFMVMIISILFFSLFSWSNPWVRMALRLAMLPVVAGVSYEINRFAGRYDNWLTILLRKPGLALQRLTTAEPTDDMIEVGIEAMKRVIPENENEDRW